MPTKKRKVVAKKTTSKVAKSVKAKTSYLDMDYSAKAVSFILYVWNILIVYFVVMNILNLVETKVDNVAALLLNYFITVILILLSFITFKSARAITAGSDDGYLAGIVVLLNMAIFGVNGLNWGVEISFVSWVFLAVAVLGLIFLVPSLGKYKQVDSHAITTWAMILHIIFWFAIVVLTPMATFA